LSGDRPKIASRSIFNENSGSINCRIKTKRLFLPPFNEFGMYAIVEIAGQQFKVQKDRKVYVHRLEAEEGSRLSFDKVLLIENEGQVTVGAPAVEGASVSAVVERHLKGDKVLVFKKKRRKGYQKMNGHRQYLSQITITGIETTAGAAKSVKAKATKAEAPAETAIESPSEQ
jgi:large subunit ribosomal protein L21